MSAIKTTAENRLHRIREAFGRTLLELGGEREDMVVVVPDMRYPTQADLYADAYPERFVDVGIAEQNCMTIAAALSTCGKVPVVCGYADFVYLRSGEQLRLDVAYNNFNVKIMQLCSGVTFGVGGSSHQTFEDIALVRAIPNLTVLVPSDSIETSKAVRAAMALEGPVYVRIGRDNEYDVYCDDNFDFEIGKAVTLREGGDIALIACGSMVREALVAADTLKKDGISARVINLHTIKPIDREAIQCAARETGAIVTVEEHNIHGGLGSAVLEALAETGGCPVKVIGFPDVFPIIGPTFEVREHYGLCGANVAREARRLLADKQKAGK